MEAALTILPHAWMGDPSKGLEARRLVWEGEQKSEFWLSYFLSLGLRSLRFAWVSYSSELFFCLFVFGPVHAAARCLSQGLLLVRTAESAVAPLTLPRPQ